MFVFIWDKPDKPSGTISNGDSLPSLKQILMELGGVAAL